MPCIDIIIVNWNSGVQLQTCVESLLSFGDSLIAKIIVVDNGSTDDSLGFLASVNSVMLIRTGENLGFGRACNLGSNEADSEYLLFLNPDARIMPGTLRVVCEYMSSDVARMVGICGVRLVDEGGNVQRHCARFPSWRTYVSLALGFSVVFPRKYLTNFMIEFDHKTSRRVDHVIGAFFFLRRELFVALDGFDERFFVYLEDLDFSLRARQAGWLTHYLADATAFHKGGGVSAQVKARRLFYSLRSHILYAFKHYRRPQAWAVAVLTMFVEPFPRLLRALIRLSRSEARDTLCGFVMLWRDSPNFIRRGLHG